MGAENTPPPSPGIPGNSRDDLGEMFEDEVDEVIDLPEAQDVSDDADLNGEEDDEEEMVELPGGIDQLESLLEEADDDDKDDSKLQFRGHKGSVFCCSLSKQGLVASGGEDDKCFVWRSGDCEVEQEVGPWGDSVTATEWSKDGNYLAVADMAGLVRVYKYPAFTEVFSQEVGDLSWLSWHPQGAHVLLAGAQDSNTWMWKIPSGDSKVMTGSGAGASCGAVLGDGRRALVGYTDGSLRIWDLKSGATQHSLGQQAAAHQDEVVSVCGHGERELAASGGMDGVAVLWNTGSGKSVCSLLVGDKQEANSEQSVECVLLEGASAVTGSLGGRLGVWDTSTGTARHTTQVGEGVTCLTLGTDGTLWCGTLEGRVRGLDLRTGNPVREFRGHKGSVLALQLQDTCLVTAGDDGVARVFDIRSNN